MCEYLMLEKEVGHPVSPKDNRDDTSLNPNPMEADDIRSEYITLFSLPASLDQPPMGAPRCQESLLGGGAGAAATGGGGKLSLREWWRH